MIKVNGNTYTKDCNNTWYQIMNGDSIKFIKITDPETIKSLDALLTIDKDISEFLTITEL